MARRKDGFPVPSSIGAELDLFRLASEFAPTHIVFTDQDGVILYANPAAERITGYSRKEMIGKRPSLWGGHMPREFYERMWDTIKRKRKSFHGEIRNRRKDGTWYVAEAWVKPVVERGRLKGFVGVERDVTDVKNAFLAVSESEKRLREITENILDVFFLLDPRSLRPLYMSPAYEELWGKKVSEVLKRPRGWASPVARADRPAFERALRRAAAGEATEIEFRIVRPDGAVRWMRAHVFLVSGVGGRVGRIAGVAEDVTGERTARTEKEHLAKDLALILSSTAEGIVRVDRENHCVFINDAACRMFGFAPEEAHGKNMHRLVHHTRLDGRPYPESACRISRMVRHGGDHPGFQKETLLRKDGSSFPVVYRAEPILENGKMVGGVVTFIDNTEQERIEARARELDIMKNKFIQVVSHQFRTPLSAVRWNLESLLNEELGPLSGEQKESVDSAYRMSTEVIRRLGDLLTALGIEEGSLTLERKKASLASVVAQAVQEASERCAAKGVRCTYRPPAASVPSLRFDAAKIRTVIEKLVENALCYTRAGGSMRVTVGMAKRTVRVTVTDTGIGIPKEEQGRVFTRFFRASSASRLLPDAAGLGLYISKHIVETHGGTIGFVSQEGKGSTFWFELPVTAPRARAKRL